MKQHNFLKKQVILFFTVFLRPMIHKIYLQRYCLLTLLLSREILDLYFSSQTQFKMKIINEIQIVLGQ